MTAEEVSHTRAVHVSNGICFDLLDEYVCIRTYGQCHAPSHTHVCILYLREYRLDLGYLNVLPLVGSELNLCCKLLWLKVTI